jgi:hypothetical protein
MALVVVAEVTLGPSFRSWKRSPDRKRPHAPWPHGQTFLVRTATAKDARAREVVPRSRAGTRRCEVSAWT